MKHKLILTVSLAIISLFNTYSQEVSTYKDKRLMIGSVMNNRIIAFQSEVRIVSNFGFRAVGGKVIGFDQAEDYGYIGIGLVTYHFPSKYDFLDPVIGFGAIYNWRHWTWDYFNTEGNIDDLNIGGGFGLGIKPYHFLEIGLNVYVYNSFREEWTAPDKVEVNSRQLQIFPAFELNFFIF